MSNKKNARYLVFVFLKFMIGVLILFIEIIFLRQTSWILGECKSIGFYLEFQGIKKKMIYDKY
jgi:hypothetical protein